MIFHNGNTLQCVSSESRSEIIRQKFQDLLLELIKQVKNIFTTHLTEDEEG